MKKFVECLDTGSEEALYNVHNAIQGIADPDLKQNFMAAAIANLRTVRALPTHLHRSWQILLTTITDVHNYKQSVAASHYNKLQRDAANLLVNAEFLIHLLGAPRYLLGQASNAREAAVKSEIEFTQNCHEKIHQNQEAAAIFLDAIYRSQDANALRTDASPTASSENNKNDKMKSDSQNDDDDNNNNNNNNDNSATDSSTNISSSTRPPPPAYGTDGQQQQHHPKTLEQLQRFGNDPVSLWSSMIQGNCVNQAPRFDNHLIKVRNVMLSKATVQPKKVDADDADKDDDDNDHDDDENNSNKKKIEFTVNPFKRVQKSVKESFNEIPRIERRVVHRALRFNSLGRPGKAAKTLLGAIADVNPLPPFFTPQRHQSGYPNMIGILDQMKSLHPPAPPDTDHRNPATCTRGPPSAWKLDQEKVRIEPPFTIQEVLNDVKSHRDGTAPGPSGWTEELLHPLLTDLHHGTIMARRITDLVNAIANNDFPENHIVRAILRECNLIALPKPSKPGDRCPTVRPIAMGEALLKIPSRLLLDRHAKELSAFFTAVGQYGIMVKGGVEKIIHSVRDLVMNQEYYVLTVDCSNAYNTPCRHKMAEVIASEEVLRPFRHLFDLEYGDYSNLYLRHKDEIQCVQSQRGCRQGSVTSPLFFCALLQPLLRKLKSDPRFKDLKVYAYMDDITLLHKDVRVLREAFLFIRSELKKLLIKVNMKKCELYGRKPLSPEETALFTDIPDDLESTKLSADAAPPSS
ncbi:MAG: hypothetical protein CMH81_06010, partial [Nitrospiraceae bacterium]|nr:hypothetical protein [Nitrospiraceae bacterium]